MRKKIPLTYEQRMLVEDHLSIVPWIIRDSIYVNEAIYGFEYDDLYQEGCIWLCHAAATYDAGLAKFSTYAKKVVRNGLLSYCRQMYAKQKYFAALPYDGNGEFLNECTVPHHLDPFSVQTGSMETQELLFSSTKDYTGVSKLGAEALGLKIQGYSNSEIAARYHAPSSHVGAWISRASRKLRNSPAFLSGILY